MWRTDPSRYRRIPLPPPAEVVAPGDGEAHAEAEQAVPPDDAIAQERGILEQIGHQHAHGQRAGGDHGGEAAVVGALEDAEQRDVHGQYDVHQRDGPQMGEAIDRRLVAEAEERDDVVRQHPHRAGDEQREHQRDRHGLTDARLDAVHPARADVLPGVGRHRRLEGVAGKVEIHLDAVAHGEGCGHGLPEAVDGPLDQRQPHGDDHQLQRDRKADGDGPLDAWDVPPVVAPLESEDRIFARHVDVSGHKGRRLGDDRRHGRADDAPMEGRDEQQVEGDVQHGRDQQEVQRGRAVADGSQYGGEDVVAVLEDQPDGIDAEILQREIEIAVGHVYDVGKRGARDENAQHREDNAQHHQKQYAGGGVLAYPGLIVRAIVLRHDDAVARRKAHRDRQQHEGKAARRADRR